MYSKLNAVINQSRIWEGQRALSHGFLLSPSAYQITAKHKQELQQLGFALYDCLLGLSHIAVIAYDKSINYSGAWSMVRKVFSTGVPMIYQETQGLNVRHIPALLKVDFMVDRSGELRIAEIDGHNKHGLGYSTLGKRFRQAIYPDANVLEGTVKLLCEEVRRMGHDTLKLFYADQERFYVPEFEIAQQEFRANGIECILMSELDACEEFVSSGLFLDLPFLYHNTGLYEKILSAYKDGTVQFIIPPKPFLGAKGVLGLLRNDAGDKELESILGAFIKEKSLELVRRHIPETVLVGKMAEGLKASQQRVLDKRYVLKESISSGMKGTVFSDDADFETVLSRACQTGINWILQEEVSNQPQSFSWFERGQDGMELKESDDWFMRVTVQYVNRKLADVMVTARRDKAVHGASDCIQIGTMII